MGERTILYMYFTNEEGKRTTVTLEDPRDDMSNQEVSQAMDEMITNNIFELSLVAKDEAKIVISTTQDLNID